MGRTYVRGRTSVRLTQTKHDMVYDRRGKFQEK